MELRAQNTAISATKCGIQQNSVKIPIAVKHVFSILVIIHGYYTSRFHLGQPFILALSNISFHTN